MDLSKTFDTLYYDLLIVKQHAYGFSEESLKLIKSYLKNRSQRGKVNISFSSWSELLLGIRQGSVLAPSLFNIYVSIFYFISLNPQIIAAMPAIQHFMFVIQIWEV